MAAKIPDEYRDQIKVWLRRGESNTYIQAESRRMWGGWYPSAGLLAQIRREVGTSGDPAVRARETARERRTQGSTCEAPGDRDPQPRRRVDLEQVLTEHLLSAEEVARDRSLGVRDRAQAVKTVQELAKQLAAEQERKRAAENAPRVTLYFPEKDELRRLEDET